MFRQTLQDNRLKWLKSLKTDNGLSQKGESHGITVSIMRHRGITEHYREQCEHTMLTLHSHCSHTVLQTVEYLFALVSYCIRLDSTLY